ncbi:Pyridoxal phosphate-dependent transferase major region subdomain 2 [Penicillium cf. griseofulvum]|uniref:Pyridoxal phosphate-dependent transferase major region subdomain 2 n=1 Tax=Penicillium cf. griseofulvum TaxID=2972120 RepID=A0A9W9T5X9_9EURO|nr:Pyridoxal phosphate-dependent transferase major region subdomain 2 [Penicillium cf. griseofulvum]KAJ5422117.1 Pyridoxal phosphate-dependent transferase major region subdomain 2 [Penicillium cf. griseofulvum]KAJ5428305.1 Pyridoxal phosphate-dependent transferase major region subdomain 2 [Penicillium cf. griseofulvum]
MSQSILSRRAQDVVDAGSGNPMWAVMKDAWDASSNPNGYVNVGVAENTLMHPELLKFINKKLELPAKYLTYNDGGGGSSRLKVAIAGFLNHNLKPVTPLQPSHIIATNGVSSAIEHVVWSFADQGEGILLGRPYYGTFIPDISLRSGGRVVPVSFGEHDPLGLDGVDKYEEALLEFHRTTGKKVKALMLAHPHNPLGRCYSREVLIKLMRLCQKYQVHFISDEIYALSVFENTVDEQPEPVKFESALSIDLTDIIDPRLVHVLWGMSKDFGANGIRLGVIISQANRDLHMALTGPTLYSYASGITDYLTTLMLEDFDFTTRYIQQNQKLLSESYAYTANYLKDNGIEYATGCNAAFFLWLNLGKRYRELHPEDECENVGERVMQRLLQKRVFLASGFLFGSEKDGWFRIVFTQGRDYLSAALERILAALEE